MIETWEKHIVFVTLHDKLAAYICREMYPDKPECWDSSLNIDIEDIHRLERTKEGKAIVWISCDDQGGSTSVEVLEDYDELYDLLVSKSKRLKRILGEKKRES